MRICLCILGYVVVVYAFSAQSREPVVEPSVNSKMLLDKIGEYYEVEVPDTLDLAERARLGLHHLTSIINVEQDYEMPFGGYFAEFVSPIMRFVANVGIAVCQCKAMEAMALLRIMSGSRENLEREAKMVETMISMLGDDGLYWVPKTPGRKPWLGPEEMRPYAYLGGQDRMLRAMIAWYQYTRDPIWKDRIDRMVDGLDRLMVVHKDDYAYFPAHGWMEEQYYSSCYIKERGWKDTTEPADEKHGEEGSLFNHQGYYPGALANWYLLTGNQQALSLSSETLRFYTKSKFWADWPGGEYPGVVGPEHAHWQGHFHGHINTLRAILEYAIATNDAKLKAFVRDGYEWARQPVLARIGYVGDGQGCGCGRLIGLAIKLTDAGVGDYWEDVDQYIRNQGTEMQFTPEDIPYLRKLGAGKPVPGENLDMVSVGVMEASMGAFSGDPVKTVFWLCCTPWGNMGLFYAWDGALRYADGVVRINLLLNRASPWMDMDSFLPYEGKVVLRNKTAQEVFVRIPLWVDRNAVSCFLGEEELPENNWFGNYLYIRDLKPAHTITIRFPVAERIEEWTIGNQVHKCRFSGNTLIEISPPLVAGSPLYNLRAEKYRAAQAPMIRLTRYVTPLVLKW